MAVTSAPGRVVRDEQGARIEIVRSYDLPVEEVWSGLTDPDRTALWIGRWSGDPASGAIEITMSAEEGAPAETVRVDRCERPLRLDLTLPSPDGDWPVSVALSQDGTATVLRLVHHLAEPYDASSTGPGWQFYLDRLTAVLTGGEVPDAWEDYWPALSEAYAVPDA